MGPAGLTSTDAESGNAWNPMIDESGMRTRDSEEHPWKARYMTDFTPSGMMTSSRSEHPSKDSLPILVTPSGTEKEPLIA